MGRYINELRWVRYATISVGFVVIGIGLIQTDELYESVLLSYKFTCPLLAFPLFAGVCGLKPDLKSFYIATSITVVTLLLAEKLLPETQSNWISVISVVTNGIAFLGTHAVRNRGFVIVSPKQEKIYLWKPQRKNLVTSAKHWLPTPQRIVQYSQKQVEMYGAPYLLFGLFCCINYIVPYFMWEHSTPHAYNLMLYLRTIGAVTCGLLLVHDRWPGALLPYLPTFWHLTLLYCLPFTSTVMFLLTGGTMEWLINVAITIMFLIVLVDWVTFVLLSVLGVGIGVLFYQYIVGPVSLHLDFSTAYLLVYTCIFTTSVALLFARRREQHLASQLQNIATQYHNTTVSIDSHEIPAVWRVAATVEQQVQESMCLYHPTTQNAASGLPQQEASDSTPDFLQYFFPTALQVIQQGKQFVKPLVKALTEDFITPHLTVLSLQSCVDTILNAYHKRHQKQVEVVPSEDGQVCVSLIHLQYAIVHVLLFLQANQPKQVISLWISQQANVHIRLSGQALSHDSIRELFTLFTPQTNAKNMGLAISRLLIEAHQGSLLSKTNALASDLYTEFVITLPSVEEKYGTKKVTG